MNTRAPLLLRHIVLLGFFMTAGLTAREQELPPDQADSLESLTKPAWVTAAAIDQPHLYYFGIGRSSVSQLAADDAARVDFSRNVSTHVKSRIERTVEENNLRIREKFSNRTEINSDMSLKGIVITERFADESLGSWHSLIRYEKNLYDSLLQEEINREFERMKAANELEEKKLEEKNRQRIALMSIDSTSRAISRKEEEQERSRIQDYLERQKTHMLFLQKNYRRFIRMKPYPRIVNTLTAEVPDTRHMFSVKGSVEPLAPLQADYRLKFFRIFDAGAQVEVRDDLVHRQSSYLKVQLLPGLGETYRTSLAFGLTQYGAELQTYSAFLNNIDSYYSEGSLFAAANVNLPRRYLTLALSSDKRRSDIALLWFPFFNNFRNRFALAADLSYTWDPAFRNRFGDRILLEPGLEFYPLENFMHITLAYEQNEFITMRFDLLRGK